MRSSICLRPVHASFNELYTSPSFLHNQGLRRFHGREPALPPPPLHRVPHEWRRGAARAQSPRCGVPKNFPEKDGAAPQVHLRCGAPPHPLFLCGCVHPQADAVCCWSSENPGFSMDVRGCWGLNLGCLKFFTSAIVMQTLPAAASSHRPPAGEPPPHRSAAAPALAQG